MRRPKDPPSTFKVPTQPISIGWILDHTKSQIQTLLTFFTSFRHINRMVGILNMSFFDSFFEL